MIGKFRKDEPHPLDEPITKVLLEMAVYGPDTEEFKTQLELLERLMKLRRKSPKRQINPDTIAIVIGNLVGIVIVVAYEQKHVMTSKAHNFILKKNP